MSDLVHMDDLNSLDGGDLRAVFGQVEPDQIVEALIGATTGLRQQLLMKLPAASASRLEAQINGHAPVSFEAALSAQRAMLEALCRLSRGGQVAFDDPADMVA